MTGTTVTTSKTPGTALARRDTWIATARVPRRNGLAHPDWRGQEALTATARPLPAPAARRRTPADWPLWAVVLLHVPPAALLVSPVIFLLHYLSN